MNTDIKAAARRIWEEIFPTCNETAPAAIIAPDSIDHDARPDEPPGIEAVRRTPLWLAIVTVGSDPGGE